MDKISSYIVDKLIKSGNVTLEQKDVYCYGIKLLISDGINFTIVLLFGALLNFFIESILFLITLCGIRKYSGGYHAKTFGLCRLTMILTFFSVVGSLKLILVITEISSKAILISAIIGMLSTSIVSIFAPVRNSKKILSFEKTKLNKNKAIVSSLFFSIISILLTSLNLKMGMTISLTLIAIVILMLLGIITQKGETTNA